MALISLMHIMQKPFYEKFKDLKGLLGLLLLAPLTSPMQTDSYSIYTVDLSCTKYGLSGAHCLMN